MAVGDPVIIMGAVGATTDYQPAAGVTVMLTQMVVGSANNAFLTDGTDFTTYISGGNDANYFTFTGNWKMLINNTTYVRMNGQAAKLAYACGFVVDAP